VALESRTSSPIGRPTTLLYAALFTSIVIADVAAALLVGALHPGLVRRLAAGLVVVLLVAPFVWWLAIRPLRRAAEAALKQSEQRYHSLFANMLEGYAYCRMLYDGGVPRDFVYLDVNSAFGKLTGLKEVVGKKVSDVVPGIAESNPELFEIYGRVALTGTPETFETYVEPLSIWFRIYVYSPEKEYFVAVFENISERKAAETERLRIDQQLRLQSSALNAAANAIVITDREGAIEWVNPAFTAMTGFALDEAVGHPPSLITAEKTDPATHAALWRTIRARQVWRGELVDRRKDGTLYNQELTITPVLGQDGALTHFVWVSQDVTNRHRLEAQLRQSQKMEAIGQLTGGIAHDFNNILAVILANTDLIGTKGEGKRMKEDIEEIRTAAIRGAAMIRKLMAFSRHADLLMVPLNLNQVVGGMSGILRRLLPESITIEEHVDNPVGTVRADMGAVEQILLNLATNARDAMPNGGTLQIETTPVTIGEEFRAAHPWASLGEYVCLSLSDTGIGMDEETKRRMFEPFFTTKPLGKGTGLGMAMIYGLVKEHQGFVHVYSEVGKGTNVKTYFPLTPGLTPVALTPGRVSAKARGGSETILVAEDEPSLRRGARRILESLGYTVLEAADGQEALGLYWAHREEVDLVISDMTMPNLGGRELYDAIQREGRPVRFILASGYARSALKVEAGSDLLFRYIPKPWTLSELAQVVREVLDQPLAT
jgi:two-component system cell cycle sensor histidine kinase/response regulator CckA